MRSPRLCRVLLILLLPAYPAAAQTTRPAGSIRDRILGRMQERSPRGTPKDVKAFKDVEYAKPGGKKLLLDLYVPQSAPKPLPVIVWIHGGGWQQGSKDQCPAVPMTARGYAAVSIQYRLTDVAQWPAQIHDCKAAIRWLRAHAREYNLDPDRIGVWGASAGGHLVAMLGTSGGVKELEGDEGNARFSSDVQAVCDWFGPTDFVAIADRLKAAGLGGHANGPVTRLLGAPVQESLQKARQASPVTWVSKDDPPFLIMHGDQDRLVPLIQSEILHKRLKAAGVDTTLYVAEGAGHGKEGFVKPEVLRMVAQFLDRTLKPGAKPTSRPE